MVLIKLSFIVADLLSKVAPSPKQRKSHFVFLICHQSVAESKPKVRGMVVPVHNDAMRDDDTVQVSGVMGRVAEEVQTVTGPVVVDLEGKNQTFFLLFFFRLRNSRLQLQETQNGRKICAAHKLSSNCANCASTDPLRKLPQSPRSFLFFRPAPLPCCFTLAERKSSALAGAKVLAHACRGLCHEKRGGGAPKPKLPLGAGLRCGRWGRCDTTFKKLVLQPFLAEGPHLFTLAAQGSAGPEGGAVRARTVVFPTHTGAKMRIQEIS